MLRHASFAEDVSKLQLAWMQMVIAGLRLKYHNHSVISIHHEKIMIVFVAVIKSWNFK